MRPKLLTMTCQVTASREAFSARGTRKCLGRTGIGCRAAALVLDLLVRQLLLLLAIGVVWRGGNVVVVVQHGHGRLHLRRRRVPHAIDVLGRDRRIRGERLLWL